MDKYFRVELIQKIPNPQQVIYMAMHTDYSEDFVFDEPIPSEEECGEKIIKYLLAGNRGHYGPLEHPQIIFNCGWFPHSVMQQIRTHRVGISMDVQSQRYTGKRIIDVVEGKRDVEEVFYLRPAGEYYADRQGGKFFYDIDMRYNDLNMVEACARNYAYNISKGMPEEQARSAIAFDIRQHWVLSGNVRSLMHLLDLRWKADAQLECQQLCDLIFPHFAYWIPSVAEWYEKNRAKKAKLSP